MLMLFCVNKICVLKVFVNNLIVLKPETWKCISWSWFFFSISKALKCGMPKNRFIQPQLDDKLFIHFGKFNYRIISIKKKYPFFHHHHHPYIYIVSAIPCRLLNRHKKLFFEVRFHHLYKYKILFTLLPSNFHAFYVLLHTQNTIRHIKRIKNDLEVVINIFFLLPKGFSISLDSCWYQKKNVTNHFHYVSSSLLLFLSIYFVYFILCPFSVPFYYEFTYFFNQNKKKYEWLI